MDIELNILQNWIQESDNIVFISGADLSAEAGFPDYRIMTQADWARYKYCLLYTSRWSEPACRRVAADRRSSALTRALTSKILKGFVM